LNVGLDQELDQVRLVLAMVEKHPACWAFLSQLNVAGFGLAVLATSRALRSLRHQQFVTGMGAPDSPTPRPEWTGPADSIGFPASSNSRARARIPDRSKRIAEFKVPRSTSTVATAPRPF